MIDLLTVLNVCPCCIQPIRSRTLSRWRSNGYKMGTGISGHCRNRKRRSEVVRVDLMTTDKITAWRIRDAMANHPLLGGCTAQISIDASHDYVMLSGWASDEGSVSDCSSAGTERSRTAAGFSQPEVLAFSAGNRTERLNRLSTTVVLTFRLQSAYLTITRRMRQSNRTALSC
jgi:hypothetical protein